MGCESRSGQVHVYKNVPSTNLIGECDFAQLDLLIQKKPSACLTTLETIIMWTNRKTPEWLDSLTQEQQSKYMTAARKCYNMSWQNMWRGRTNSRGEMGRFPELSSEEERVGRKKKKRSTAALVNEVVELRGVWTTEQQILS